MKSFEDIQKLKDTDIQTMLRELEMEDLVLALKGTSNENSKAIKRNMSEQSVAQLEEEMEKVGAAPIEDVEKAQEKILGVINKLGLIV